jgi:hypothetical protein
MKKRITFLTIAIFTLMTCLSAYAKNGTIECSGVAGNSNDLIIYTYNSELRAVKLITSNNGDARTLFIHPLKNQNIEGVTLYSIAFAPSSLMQVDNSVIAGLSGNARLFGFDFNCNQN